MTIMLCVVAVATMVSAASGINPGDMTGTPSGASDQISSLGNQIIGVVQGIGIVVSVVVVIVLGIKYMMGSVEEKAEYKKTMMPYLIGAALIFAASTISMAVMNFIGTAG